MKISLVIAAITVLLSVVCLYSEARPRKAQKTMGFLRKIHDRNVRPARSVFPSKEEDEEDDEEEEEEEGWSSKEDAELFLNIFDRNNDGMIDEPELWAFFEALSYDELDIKHMVDAVFEMDHDHDAYLSAEEIAAAMEKGFL